MEPSSVIDDAEFWLPPEFLTDEDFLVEKENNVVGIDESDSYLFPNEPRHGFEYFGGFGSTVKPNAVKESDEENFLAGLTRQMVQSSLEDDFSGGFCGNHAFPVGNENKGWGMSRSPLCVTGTGCCCRNQRSNRNCNSRVSSWDLYCSAAEEAARLNINDEPYHSGRGLLGPPTKLSSSTVAAVKNHPNNGTGYYNHHQTLPYQKLQAIQFEQLKQQQLMKHHRQLVHQSRGGRVNGNKNVGPMDLSSSAWSNNQLPRRDVMRAVFIGDHTVKRGSTGTGVFLPRNVSHTARRAEPRDDKPTLSTVLVPARLAQVLNLNLDEPVRSSASLNDVSWRQRSNGGGFSRQMHGGVRAELPVNEPRLPSDWAY